MQVLQGSRNPHLSTSKPYDRGLPPCAAISAAAPDAEFTKATSGTITPSWPQGPPWAAELLYLPESAASMMPDVADVYMALDCRE